MAIEPDRTGPAGQGGNRPPLYDGIGHGYASARRPDPHIAAQIHAGLGDAHRILNVGAGAGSYEPIDRMVIAVEPSPTISLR